MTLSKGRPPVDAVFLDGDLELTASDIVDLGLEEAHENAGASLEEIAMAGIRRSGRG